jgi:hypothetical protein
MDEWSEWQQVVRALGAIHEQATGVYPIELPPESDPQFWWEVCRHEMTTRRDVDELLRQAVNDGAPIVASPLLWFFLLRRLEWAAQLVEARIVADRPPFVDTKKTLEKVLIDSWQSDGSIALWHFAERGGPHPDNPDGLQHLR